MLIKEENYTLDSLLENTLIISDCINSTINQIPVVYNEEGNYCLVKYRDIEELQEQYNLDINNAVSCISNFNNIDTNSVVLTVNESDIIEYPEIASILESENVEYVIDPIPMDNPTVQLCDYLVEEALETGDESCLDVLEEDYTVVNEVLDKLTPEEKENLRKKLSYARYKSSKDSIKKFKAKYRPMVDKFASVVGKDMADNAFSHFFHTYTKYETKGGKLKKKYSGPSHYTKIIAQNRKSKERTNLIKDAFKLNNSRKKTKSDNLLPVISNSNNGSSNNGATINIGRGKKSENNSSNKHYANNKTTKDTGSTPTNTPLVKSSSGENKMKIGLAGLGLGAAAFAIKNRKSIINRIKGLRAKSDQLEQKMQAAPVEKKGLFRRIIDKIKSIIQKLIAKLKSLRK